MSSNRIQPTLIAVIASLALWLSGCVPQSSPPFGLGPVAQNATTDATTTSASEETPSADCQAAGNTDESLDCIRSESLGEAPLGAAPPQSNVDPEGGYAYTVEQYMDFIIADLDREWSQWFVSAGFSEPLVTITKVEPGTQTASKCFTQPIPDDHPNAYFCSLDAEGGSDGALILPVTTFQKMWTGDIFERNSKEAGDFAAAILIAHEFGHHVQTSIYLQYNAANPQAPLPDFAAGNKIKELIADCFAGNWMATAYYDGILEPGDLDEAVAGLDAIGDTGVSEFPHGTGEERKAALLTGYNGTAETSPGDPRACISTYWR